MRHFTWFLRRERILPNFQNFKKKRHRLTPVGFSLLFILLGLVTFLTVGFQVEKVRAIEIGDKIVRTSWRETSFPVENFQRYSSPYGYRWHPDGSTGWGFHRGLDIAAPSGSYIRNWASGEVVEVGSDRLCGTKVVVRSDEWEHVYCHMKGRPQKSPEGRYLSDGNGVLVRQGEYIKAGTRIGQVGMTGRTTGPHLHWGVKYHGSYIDPALVLQAMYQQQISY